MGGALMRIQWNKTGFYDLRREPGVVVDLQARAERIAAAASARGGEYLVGSVQGEKRPQGRWRASVVTADHTAIRKNAKYHTLLGALDRGR